MYIGIYVYVHVCAIYVFGNEGVYVYVSMHTCIYVYVHVCAIYVLPMVFLLIHYVIVCL